MPVGLDLRAIGHGETDGAEQLLDAVERAHHGMDAAARLAAPGQGHIERFGGKLGFELRALQRVAARGQRGLDGILGGIDRGAGALALLGGQLAQPLEQRGQRTFLAEIGRLDFFKTHKLDGRRKISGRLSNELIQIVHAVMTPENRRPPCVQAAFSMGRVRV